MPAGDVMTAATTAVQPFDFGPLLADGLPPPAARWNGFPRYNFIGGHNDAAQVPVSDLVAAANAVLTREGRTLATYGLQSGPLGYRRLREFLVDKLKRNASISCTIDEILLTSGSLQGLDLVNGLLLSEGDTVITEQVTYFGTLSRLARRGINVVGVPLDHEGLRMDALSSALDDLRGRDIRPKFIYTIPTVQNPTGAIMGVERRLELIRLAQAYNVPVFEDDCYADLTWDGRRPPAIYALSTSRNVIYIGSFSKTIAPALRLGFLVADWSVLARLLPLKTDAGSGALEQMVVAEYCMSHFNEHVPELAKTLRGKVEVMMESLAEQFGTAAEFDDPKGGIFLWIKLPDVVDASRLAQAALAEGVAINPGFEWSPDKAHAKSRMRLCFGNPTCEEIRAGIAVLADVCRREFGVPARIANVERAR
jgi:2-aminoadipate transaminase